MALSDRRLGDLFLAAYDGSDSEGPGSTLLAWRPAAFVDAVEDRPGRSRRERPRIGVIVAASVIGAVAVLGIGAWPAMSAGAQRAVSSQRQPMVRNQPAAAPTSLPPSRSTHAPALTASATGGTSPTVLSWWTDG